jgi:hypothetical protein
LRDYEVFNTENFSSDEIRLLNKAQFFTGKPNEEGHITLESKIEAMSELCAEDLGLLSLIDDFTTATSFFINEVVFLRCTQFDPRKWVDTRISQAELLRVDAETRRNDPDSYVTLIEAAEEIEAEAIDITKTLEKGGEVLADLEEVDLRVHPLNFFPPVF